MPGDTYFRFSGQYFDEETGLFHNGFRDYDSGSGRYIESDPLGLRAGPNTYAYGLNSPLSNIDPLGLSTMRISAHRDRPFR
ncbi:RHS repeat-associated core domain-containing protein [Dyella sp. M7H15-1]|uniref:RHS repeat-associated core domain-containing protein n=1 Tax=Dyella sp. M7H15-1 TaxID=2501295 RepID=UPI0031B6AFE7